MTRKEQLNYRDLHNSKKHRELGDKLTMFDADAIEYHPDTHLPVALIEDKHGNIPSIDFDAIQFRCHLNTANKLEIPFYCVVYYHLNACGNPVNGDQDYSFITHSQYFVIPLNTFATTYVAEPTMLSAANYSRLLHKLRGLSIAHIVSSPKPRPVSIPQLINYKVR